MRNSNYQSQTCRKDNVKIQYNRRHVLIHLSLSLQRNKLLFQRKLYFSDIHVCIYWLSSRYDVRETNKTENEVTVSEEATKVDRERSFDYNFEYNNKASSLFLDVTQLVISYAGMLFFFRFQKLNAHAENTQVRAWRALVYSRAWYRQFVLSVNIWLK